MNFKVFTELFALLDSTFKAFLDEKNESANPVSFCGLDRTELKKIIPDDEPLLIRLSINRIELLILYLVTLPLYYPNCYRVLRYLQKTDEDFFSILGGCIMGDNKQYYPTRDTILYILGGNYIENRIDIEKYLTLLSPLFRYSYLQIQNIKADSLPHQQIYYPSPEVLSILKGEDFVPDYSANFPAKQLETKMEWDDLILSYNTNEALNELCLWLKHKHNLILLENVNKRVKPGYRTLFYGPPGTGKTLAASLIGKRFGLPVYRVDLSMVVSKWVGETEKNLQQLFNMAEHKDWILFFDEADSLFGKRTSTSSSNDRYANQEVSYLLQRIEDYPGLIILASNLKSNMDAAFMRRFQSTVLFPMPDEDTRRQLWEHSFPHDFELDEEINIREIAKKYEIAGGAITNVIRYCVLCALENGNKIIMYDDLEFAIIREFRKSGKIAV